MILNLSKICDLFVIVYVCDLFVIYYAFRHFGLFFGDIFAPMTRRIDAEPCVRCLPQPYEPEPEPLP